MARKELSVADVMTFDPIVVAADASLEEADIALRSTYVMGLPVVDRNGTLVGVITHANLAVHRFVLRTPFERDRQDDMAAR